MVLKDTGHPNLTRLLSYICGFYCISHTNPTMSRIGDNFSHTIINTHSMTPYVLLSHITHKNDVVKLLFRATSRRQVAL